MITYNDIYEALRKERYCEQLQNLGPKFVTEVYIYLKEKRTISEKYGDLFSEAISKTKKQFADIMKVVGLYTRRFPLLNSNDGGHNDQRPQSNEKCFDEMISAK